MWKELNRGAKVSVGDTIRFSGAVPAKNQQLSYTVVKTDQHYFEIAPTEEINTGILILKSNVIRYFDIGYYHKVEIRIQDAYCLEL